MQLLAHGCVSCRCGWSLPASLGGGGLVLLGLVAGDGVALPERWETRRFPALVVQELGGRVGCLHVASVPQNRTCLCSTPVTMSFCCDSQFVHSTRVNLAQHIVTIHVNHKRVGDPPTKKT